MKNSTFFTIAILLFTIVACQPTQPESLEDSQTDAETVSVTVLNTQGETVTSEPVPIISTKTPTPQYIEPVELLYLEGEGDFTTEEYDLPACDKAVFNWKTLSSPSGGPASLILEAYYVDNDETLFIINRFEDIDPDEEYVGQALERLGGGKYSFSFKNAKEPWSVRIICQDNQAPIVGGVDIQGEGDVVTDNFELLTCNKSIFSWTVEPDETGYVSTSVYIFHISPGYGEKIFGIVETDQTTTIKGETILDFNDGHYYFYTESKKSTPWTLTWECQD